ncbi:hypothetical protein ACHAWF_015480 [Thalassiosira exigua]
MIPPSPSIVAITAVAAFVGGRASSRSECDLHAALEPQDVAAVPLRCRRQHEHDGLRRQYDRAGGILYKRSALPPDEFRAVMEAIRSEYPRMEEEGASSFAHGRVGARVPESSGVRRLLGSEDGGLCRLVNDLTGEEGQLGRMILAPDVPIEIRVYERVGAGMEWHVDDDLYLPGQVEVVLTLENSSDCTTMWRPHDLPLPSDGSGVKYDVRSEQTTPNSALILRAGSVEHKVSPLRVGRRAILKMAFVREGAKPIDGALEAHASHHSGGREKSRSGKKSGVGRRAGKGKPKPKR